MNDRFPGQHADATNLNYNGARNYLPDFALAGGRYAEADPIGLSGGINPYVYAGNNAYSNIDPLGLDWVYDQNSGVLAHYDMSFKKPDVVNQLLPSSNCSCSRSKGESSPNTPDYYPRSLPGGPQPDFVTTGYAGNGAGFNNSDLQSKYNEGPINQGGYTIGQQGNYTFRNGHTVRNSLPLAPDPGQYMYGRTGGYFMHGDNKAHNHTASDGCIVTDLPTRNSVARSGDTRLIVVP